MRHFGPWPACQWPSGDADDQRAADHLRVEDARGLIPAYDATVTANLRNAGAVIIGKTNMDEFAMGSSTENSAFGPTRNPWDAGRIPGGSSGGSAVAVAARQAPLSIGTTPAVRSGSRPPSDRRGRGEADLRRGLPLRAGRIGLTLDQAGPFATTVADAAMLHAVMAGHDPRDSTSIDAPVPPVVRRREPRRQGHADRGREAADRRGIPAEVREHFQESLDALADAGAEIVEVSCPHFEYALAAYYLILPSEASSNLAKVRRHALRPAGGDDGDRSVEQVMALTREAGFGPEVKRRIMLGTYALSSGYYDAYYGQAQKVRTLIANDSPRPSRRPMSWPRRPPRRPPFRSVRRWMTLEHVLAGHRHDPG